MRLVCPNCEAKYEVPEDAIPETGRDVQCANCGHAWYQMRPRAAVTEPAAAAVAPAAPAPAPSPPPALEPAPVIEAPVAEEMTAAPPEPAAEEPAEVGAASTEPLPEPETVADIAEAVAEDVSVPVAEETADAAPSEIAEVAVEAAAELSSADTAADVPADVPAGVEAEDHGTITAVGAVPAVEATVAEGAVAEAAIAVSEDLVEDEADAEPPAAAAPAAYAVDDSVLAILREEAEREAQARRAESAKPLETQTDLGIEVAIPAAKRAVEVASATVVEADGDDKLANRRTRLPDVEEINSTLRPTEAPQDGSGATDALPVAAEGRSSFRSGFLLVMTVAILGSALYGSADALAEAIPALAGPLKAYVGFVDSLRLHLDGLMQSATVAINGN